jgi:hypothetical protein
MSRDRFLFMIGTLLAFLAIAVALFLIIYPTLRSDSPLKEWQPGRRADLRSGEPAFVGS